MPHVFNQPAIRSNGSKAASLLSAFKPSAHEANYEDEDREDDDEDDEAPPEPGQEYLETSRQLGAAFYDDSRGVDSFSKLCRYEATIRRCFYKALKQFCRAEAHRLYAAADPYRSSISASSGGRLVRDGLWRVG